MNLIEKGKENQIQQNKHNNSSTEHLLLIKSNKNLDD